MGRIREEKTRRKKPEEDDAAKGAGFSDEIVDSSRQKQ